MEQLKDLGLIYSHAADKFRQYDGKDFVLPSEFKEQVKAVSYTHLTLPTILRV